ncbi:MAG: lipopolysaccharide biosynthesis protein [Burkholderiaceae bacterium]
MSASTAQSEAGRGLRRSILSLSMVNAIDMAFQFLIPMLLVRLLGDADFGAYRTLWLLATTAIGVLGFAVPFSLYYFVPRLPRVESAVFVRQAGLYMALAGALGALAAAWWCSWQGMNLHLGTGVALFVGIWVFASLLDAFFSSQQRAVEQAKLNLFFALLRVGLIIGAAQQWNSWEAVLIAHLVLASAKGLACAVGVARFSAAGARIRSQTVSEHARYVAPFGVSSAMYLLRGRIDQWLVASTFSAAQFGLYSVAAVIIPIQGLLRMTINQVVLPEMNRLQSTGNLDEMQAVNRRGNLAVALLMFPVLAFLSSRTEALLDFLFTADYSAAASVVRIYCVMLLIESIEVTMILTAMRQGSFMMRIDALVLPIVVAVSWLGASEFGPSGAAAGGAAGALIAQVAAFRRTSVVTGTPVRDCQDWWVLGRISLAAAVSAGLLLCLHGGVLGQPPVVESGLLALLIDGAGFMVVYWLCLRALRLRTAVRDALGASAARFIGFGGP